MNDSRKTHWERVYGTKQTTEVSWYQPVPARSLELICATGEPLTAPILDVGSGASTLVDHLLGEGYLDITVLDIAANALDCTRSRLGDLAARVTWTEADITRFQPRRKYALWHDRAVFHFLTDTKDRERYLDTLRRTLSSRGHFLLATFGPEGPTRCSGLAIQRYSAQDISALLGSGFALRMYHLEEHHTSTGAAQQFLYGWWQAEA
ncbi:MAG: class I SAM-dependent methyltransferase [Smithellaceae bacterium]|nr:class I SAM-dependent methyltransferase [Smithellaceae bacterium]